MAHLLSQPQLLATHCVLPFVLSQKTRPSALGPKSTKHLFTKYQHPPASCLSHTINLSRIRTEINISNKKFGDAYWENKREQRKNWQDSETKNLCISCLILCFCVRVLVLLILYYSAMFACFV